MSHLANIVVVKVDPGVIDRIKPAMLENAHNSVEEEGCLQFDVVQSQADENTYLFYEIYTDAAALASHRETAHFKKYWDLLVELDDKVAREAVLYDVIS